VHQGNNVVTRSGEQVRFSRCCSIQHLKIVQNCFRSQSRRIHTFVQSSIPNALDGLLFCRLRILVQGRSSSISAHSQFVQNTAICCCRINHPHDFEHFCRNGLQRRISKRELAPASMPGTGNSGLVAIAQPVRSIRLNCHPGCISKFTKQRVMRIWIAGVSSMLHRRDGKHAKIKYAF
jgi:hypothetical protein